MSEENLPGITIIEIKSGLKLPTALRQYIIDHEYIEADEIRNILKTDAETKTFVLNAIEDLTKKYAVIGYLLKSQIEKLKELLN